MVTKRYSRHELVEQIGFKAQNMRSKTVTVLGLGGVGTVVAEILVRSGINVRIIDKGRILEEDLQRSFLFLEDDINKFKAKQAKKRLELILNTKKEKCKKDYQLSLFKLFCFLQIHFLLKSLALINFSICLLKDKYAFNKKTVNN